MNHRDIENRLTPAARQALAELVDNYRTQVLFGALRSAGSYAREVEEISVRDVLASLERVEAVQRGERRPITDQLYGAAMFGGLLYAVLGFGYFLAQRTQVPLDPAQTIGLVTGIAGTLVALTIYYYRRQRAQERALRQHVIRREPFGARSVQESDGSILLVPAWREIELAIRAFVASKYGESTARRPISMLIAQVEDSQVLSSEDRGRLMRLLSLRNEVLHEGTVLDARQLRDALQDAERILTKLRRPIQPT